MHVRFRVVAPSLLLWTCGHLTLKVHRLLRVAEIRQSYNTLDDDRFSLVNCATLLLGIGGVLISLSKAMIPLLSVTHGQCDARPTVTFSATRHHRPLAGTKLYCLVTEAHVC